MSFGKAVKIFQLQILKQSGVNVTPQQLGLKSDPIADLQAQNLAGGSFRNVLGGLTPPTPPTPPADLTDSAAQTQYQQDLLAYNNNFQSYNQRMMQLMLQQFQTMQQSLVAMQRNNTNNSSTTDNSDTGAVGGILG
ncbi:hypothetical protein [Vampirovibrio sp.]|uniref:hypothetical protein n=1 Tax=Vampirovibrio sp. TaxID=2717857 RepID=UPI0035939BB6